MTGKSKFEMTWGGKRPGAGRPRKSKTASEKSRYAIMKAARKLAREHGMPIEEAILSMIYDPKVQDSVKASIWKTYLESLVAKETENRFDIESKPFRMSGTLILPAKAFDAIKYLPSEVRSMLPAIILPEMNPDPALEIMKSSKGKNNDENIS